MPAVLERKNIKLAMNMAGSQCEGALRSKEMSYPSSYCSITSELDKSQKSLKSRFPPWHAETLELLCILKGEKYLMVLLYCA